MIKLIIGKVIQKNGHFACFPQEVVFALAKMGFFRKKKRVPVFAGHPKVCVCICVWMCYSLIMITKYLVCFQKAAVFVMFKVNIPFSPSVRV